jgi:predicted DNA-binding mobile mystery protein A
MSSAALAQQLHITGSAVRKLEEAESSDAITLATLRRIAAALDCELQYALVPKQKLEIKRHNRAMVVAQERVAGVARSMALENQAVDDALTQAQIQELAQSLLNKRNKDLW